MKATKRPAKRAALRRTRDKLGESYSFAPNPGTTLVCSFGKGRDKTVAIYGDPKGLRYLAKLLNDVADVDQSKVPDINCPPGVSVHYHVYNRSGLVHPKSESLVLARIDAKDGGTCFPPLL